MQVIQKENSQVAARFAAAHATDLLKKGLAQKVPALFLTSGGSGMNILDYIDPNVLTSSLTVGLLDERFSEDPTVNSFAQLTKHPFFGAASQKGVSFIDTRISGKEKLMARVDGASELAVRMEYSYKNWKEHNLGGKIYIIQGIGTDGHTAGIMPYPNDPEGFQKLFERPNYWTVGYDAKGKNQYRYRATVTNTFLRNAVDMSIAYAVGEEKKAALARVTSGADPVHAVPARVMHEMKEVYLYTDVRG